jgi:hypothetical protein
MLRKYNTNLAYQIKYLSSKGLGLIKIRKRLRAVLPKNRLPSLKSIKTYWKK